QEIDHPRAFRYVDAVTQRRGELVALHRCDAAELRLDRAALECRDHLAARHEMCGVAVEIGMARAEVMREAPAGPVIAFDVLDEDERAGSHHMLRGITRIRLELRRAVDAVPGRGE